ncbi:MAG: flagellar basal body P-ring protein FlgI [Pseudomonadota bacterium]
MTIRILSQARTFLFAFAAGVAGFTAAAPTALGDAPQFEPPVIEASAAGLRNGVRIKDLVDIEGVRGNDLVGYGLVVGLDGSGDALRNSPFTEEALVNLLERLGINVSGEAFRTKNVAAVLVTAKLPPFSRTGSRIDITVSTIGDAKSLRGGTLIMTPLSAPDGEIYAVAQGTVIAGGVGAEGDAASVTVGSPTAGGIPGGATVEREVDFNFGGMREIDLSLREPDFTTAERVEQAINSSLGARVAHLRDSGTVTLDLANIGSINPARFVSRIENLRVVPDRKARVVVDQRSGTIVLGSDVRISPIAVTQGNLTIRVAETPVVSQPNPFTEDGETVVVPRTDVDIEEEEGPGLALIGGEVTLGDLVAGLNALGVGPNDMTDILKTIKAAGALHAEFVVQ